MTRYLLDTDTCIYFRQKRPPHLVRRFDKLNAGDVAMSVITFGELYRGALRSRKPELSLQVLERITSLAPVLGLPDAAGATYAEIRVELERAGQIIGGNDLWIAAHAKALNLTLVTGNIREFSRVTGLAHEDWIGPR